MKSQVDNTEYANILRNDTYLEANVMPVGFKGRIVDRRQTQLQYQHLEKETDFLKKTDRNIDAQALMLQVKLWNERTQDKDLEDPNVIEYLNKYVDSRHPRIKLDSGVAVPFPLLNTNTGIMGCTKSHSQSDLAPLGLGMVIYFKILKTYAIIFFCLMLLNIPLYYIYSSNHPELKVTSYKDILYKSTIGNIGSTLYNCDKIPVSEFNKNSYYTFDLDCQNYNISTVTAFGATSNINYFSQSSSSCHNYTSSINITSDSSCDYTDYLNNVTKAACPNNKNCSFTLDVTDIQNSCLSSFTNQYLFLSYICYDSNVNVGNNIVDRSVIAWVVVGLDIASMVILILAMVIIPISQVRTEKFFKENVVEISDYTMHFKNLDFDNYTIYKELDDFIAHLYKIHQYENQYLLEEEEFIYDINYPIFNDSKIGMLKEKAEINALIEEKESEYESNLDEKLLIEINELKEKEIKLTQIIRDTHYSYLPKINDVYVTFTKQSFKNKLTKAYQKGCCTRCCIIFCCKFHTIKHYYFRHKWLNIEEATDQPSNLKWENIPYSPMRRYLRQCIVFFIALIILAFSFGVVIGAKYAEKSISSQFNTNIDCSLIEYTDQSVYQEFTDITIPNRDRFLAYCYCSNKLSTDGLFKTQSAMINNTEICLTWTTLYVKSQSLMIGTILLVPIINVVLSAILSILTQLERNKSISANMTSNMWKSFLLQLINTAIIILIVNMSIQSIKNSIPDFPLFTGNYSDLTSGWYNQVGATFLFYMFLNIITPHSNALIQYLGKVFLRHFDKHLNKWTKKYTRKKSRKEYIDLYTGPEFNIGMRYSQIMTTIFAILIFSSGIPLLYLCCFLFFLVTYWIDKWLVLRLYKSPPHIDLYVTKLFNMIILCAIIIHFLFAIWIYGNDQLLSNSANSSLASISTWIQSYLKKDGSFWVSFLYRLSYSYNILILFFLALIVLVFIIRVLYLDHLFFACCKFYDPDLHKVKDINIYDAIDVKGLYLNHQIRKAQYFVVADTGINFPYYKQFYFEKIIRLDRYQIANRIRESTQFDLSLDDKYFNLKLAKIIRQVDITDKPIIQGEFSYNITYIPEFQIVAKHEFFDKYSIDFDERFDKKSSLKFK